MRIRIGEPNAQKATVVFNGHPRKDVIMADEEAGEIEVLFYNNAMWGVQTKTLHGKVFICFMEHAFR